MSTRQPIMISGPRGTATVYVKEPMDKREREASIEHLVQLMAYLAGDNPDQYTATELKERT
jgi:hypothetical protein